MAAEVDLNPEVKANILDKMALVFRSGRGIIITARSPVKIARNVYFSSVSCSNRGWRMNYRENGIYKHILVKSSLTQSWPQHEQLRCVTRNTTYTNFGTQVKPKTSWSRIITMISLPLIILLVAGIEYEEVEAREIDQDSRNETASAEESKGDNKTKQGSGREYSEDWQEKSTRGFHDQHMAKYENRLRSYSTADKNFRYFATLKVCHRHGYDIYMTPEDFVRSITPGMLQPKGLGLDEFKRFDPKVDKVKLDIDPDSLFNKLGECGLINFSDYVFLLVVLSTPPRNFEIAFRMFDINGDGEVDHAEFSRISNILRGQTSVGKRHRDHVVTGSVVKGISSALSTYFFGPDGTEKLTVQEFLNFQKELQKEVLKLEFNRYKEEEGRISERDFAKMLLRYAGFSDNRKKRMIKRVNTAFTGDMAKGITFKEYENFWLFLQNITDVDTALSFYHVAGVSIDQETFKHVARTVVNVELSDHVVDVVFKLFDENKDGQLSNQEFVWVMKRRLLMGLDHSKEIGVRKLVMSVGKCCGSQVSYWYRYLNKESEEAT